MTTSRWRLLASGRFYRRGGHAGGCFHAELLFRLAAAAGFMLSNDLLIGDRRAGRFVRRDPVLHYV